jgi:mycothiol system anti-sigma-R factor
MSRDCDEVLANLYNFIDAELDGLSAERIKIHLQACGICDRPFEFERRLRQVIRERLNEEVPDVLVVKLKALIAVESTTGH